MQNPRGPPCSAEAEWFKFKCGGQFFGIFFRGGARVFSILSEPKVFVPACEDSFNSGGGSMADEDVARAWRDTDTELRSKGICGVEECCTLAYTFFSAPKIADDSAA